MTDIEKKESEDRSGMFVGGSIVLGVGILFLLVNMDILPPLDETWPLFIIIVGLALIIGGFARKKKSKT
ncbi:MAG: hypothetical protein DRP51_06440, partial [Candidatus Zixiibacteriota bacterium]